MKPCSFLGKLKKKATGRVLGSTRSVKVTLVKAHTPTELQGLHLLTQLLRCRDKADTRFF